MLSINKNFQKLPGAYLFSTVARLAEEYQKAHPERGLIKMSIGDVTRPIAPSVVRAMEAAAREMGTAEGFRGYGPEQGYDFLRSAIVKNDYLSRGIELDISEVFVSDGAKSDCGNIGDIFGTDNIVAVCDPVYPVYVDTNAMAGRAGEYMDGRWSRLVYMPCTEENGFLPELPKTSVDIIYLCFPNNPTGAAATRVQLKKWVDYARDRGAVILYDSAYEAFITDPDIPHSIYEIDGAKECAIEFRSFSKTAGFTGMRCAYTIVPHELKCDGAELNALWNRRQCTKFNGVPYVVQRAAEAVYSPDGQRETRAAIEYYLENAKIIRTALSASGLSVSGGENAPYIWAKAPKNMGSWDFFNEILNKTGVVTTPGAGFGPSGEGYVRLTAFSAKENTQKAMELLGNII